MYTKFSPIDSEIRVNPVTDSVLDNMSDDVYNACLEAISSLNDNEYKVLSLLLGLNPEGVHLRRIQIAKLLGISSTRVNTLLNSAYRKLSIPEVQQALKKHMKVTNL